MAASERVVVVHGATSGRLDAVLRNAGLCLAYSDHECSVWVPSGASAVPVSRRRGPACASPVPGLLLTVNEAAAELRLSRSRLYELIDAEVIRVVRIGRSVRITRTEIEAFVAGLAQGAATDARGGGGEVAVARTAECRISA